MKTFCLMILTALISLPALAQDDDWRVYNRFGATITAKQLADAVAVEKAVEKANVEPKSQAAAAIRINMGQSPEIAGAPNDQAFTASGETLTHKEAAKRFAAIEMMSRAGIDPDSEQAAQIRAAAQGNVETAEGEPVDQQTMEEMAKEAAVQEAMIYTGTEAGSPNEALIRMGADSMMEKIKGWWD